MSCLTATDAEVEDQLLSLSKDNKLCVLHYLRSIFVKLMSLAYGYMPTSVPAPCMNRSGLSRPTPTVFLVIPATFYRVAGHAPLGHSHPVAAAREICPSRAAPAR